MKIQSNFKSFFVNFVVRFTFSVLVIVAYSGQSTCAFSDSDFLSEQGLDLPFFLDDISKQIMSSALLSYDKSQNPAVVVSSCQAFITAYADVVASFARCSVLYARPLRFCQHCVREFVTANSYSTVILKDVAVVDRDGHSCWESISESDRVQIIIKNIQFIDDLWQECECQNCFEYAHIINDTVEVKLNNDTVQFFQKANETLDCFHNKSQPMSGDDLFDNSTCEQCAEKYDELNSFYHDLENKYSHGTCMDIVDMMNSTRYTWSNKYHCNSHPNNLVPVFVLSGFLSLLPVVFYVGNKIHGSSVQNKLMKQRRLKDVTESGSNQPAQQTSSAQRSSSA